MLRLGFSGRILSQPRLLTHDAARSGRRPHLSLSLLYLRDVIEHLIRHSIRLYRLPAQLAPYLTDPLRPRFHDQIAECAADLANLGALAAAGAIRLSMHLPASVILSAPDAALAARSRHEIEMHARLLHAFGPGDPVLVAHIGGAYGDKPAALARCVERIGQLSDLARAVLALEPDGRAWSLVDALHIHARSGVPIVLDHLHHQLYDPHGLPGGEALEYALATWPAGRRPKAHFSSPRTELRIAAVPGAQPRLQAPTWHEHSDYAHPFELLRALRLPAGRPYDLMLEVKAGDLALLRAREDIARFAPELAGRIE